MPEPKHQSRQKKLVCFVIGDFLINKSSKQYFFKYNSNKSTINQ